MERIGPDLYRLSSGGAAAVHLVMGPVRTLVDAGAPGRGPTIELELRAAGLRADRIVYSHGDPDHVGGSDHLRASMGAEVWAPGPERPLIDRSGWSALPRTRRTLMRLFFRGTPAPTVDRWFDASDDLDGLVVVPTPGHTPGHVAFEWRGWLLAGDAFVSGRRFRESLGIFTLDRLTSRRSIEALASRNLDGVSSSHGRPVKQATKRLEALIAGWH
jgi:hydroxyacylglutathione hydrolase